MGFWHTFLLALVFFINLAIRATPFTRLTLALAIASVFATLLWFYKNHFSFPSLPANNILYISIGAILALVLGEMFFIKSIATSGVTIAALTSLTLPFVAAILELIFYSRTFSIYEVVGMLLLVVGTVVLVLGKPLK
jgi:drug/metabolite transporter (DMT)-like permease